MLHVFRGGDPFQVFKTIIKLISILMVYTTLIGGVFEKSISK